MARMDAARPGPARDSTPLHWCTFAIASVLLLGGCTTASRSTADAFRLLLPRSVEPTREAVASNRFPQMQVRTSDLASVAVLGYVDGNRQQWYAGKHGVFETDSNGLLLGASVQVHRWETTIIGQSPFNDLLRLSAPVTVQRKYDWLDSYQLGVMVTGTLSREGIEEIDILGQKWSLIRLEEHLQGGGMNNRNIYWVDPETGLIRKSRQFLAPNYAVELTQLKPYRKTQN